MLIHRWQAPLVPTLAQLSLLLDREGLDHQEEKYSPGEKVQEHRHPHTEIRIVAQGALMFNIAGNQVLLRQGDRIEIPPNTKHSHAAQGEEQAVCIVAYRLA